MAAVSSLSWRGDPTKDVELLGYSKAASVSHFALLEDFFPWTETRPVDVNGLLSDREQAQHVSPYCICARNGCIVLVQLPSAASYNDPGALFFETQRRRATRVFCVPFQRAQQLAQELAPRLDIGRILVVFNTGRCGSNLLSAGLAEFEGVCSISEPDVFAPLYVPVPPQADVGSAEAASQLVWAATVLLLHWAQSATPGFQLLTVKARSRLAGDMSTALRALPGVHAAMMYRGFLPTLGSMAIAFRPRARWRPVMAAACALGLDPALFCVAWLLGWPWWRDLVGMRVVAEARPPVPPRLLWRCGNLAVHVVKVINSLDQARRAHQQGLLSFCITYEDLVRHRGAYLQQILAAARALRTDSEKGRPSCDQVDTNVKPPEPQSRACFALRSGASLDRVFEADQHHGWLASCSGGATMWRGVSQGVVRVHGLTPAQALHIEALRRWLQPGQRDADEPLPGTIMPWK